MTGEETFRCSNGNAGNIRSGLSGLEAIIVEQRAEIERLRAALAAAQSAADTHAQKILEMHAPQVQPSWEAAIDAALASCRDTWHPWTRDNVKQALMRHAPVVAPQPAETQGEVLKGWIARNLHTGLLDYTFLPDSLCVNTNHYVAHPCTVIIHDPPPQPPEPEKPELNLAVISRILESDASGEKQLRETGRMLVEECERLQAAAGKGEP